MTDVIQYLKQYLIHHRSVVISRLGQFTTEPMGAMIHPIIHEFKPPHSLLLFEENITGETSAEFIAFICLKTGLTTEEANNQVEVFSKDIHDGLKTENAFVIDEFGTFKRLPDHSVAFEADENIQLNSEAFGLPSFTLVQNTVSESVPLQQTQQEISEIQNLPVNEENEKAEDLVTSEHAIDTPQVAAIQADNQTESAEQESGETLTEPLNTEQPSEYRPKRKRAWIVWLLLLFILAGGLTGLYISGYLNILYEKSISLIKDHDKSEEFVSEMADNDAPLFTEKTEELTVQNDAVDEIEVKEQTQPVEIVTPKQSKIRYFVVADCYTYKDLAEQRVKNLQAEGYQSSIAGQTKQGHFIVTYGEYSDKAEAETQLKDIKKNVNKHAWLYIR